eukprot:g20581.t1
MNTKLDATQSETMMKILGDGFISDGPEELIGPFFGRHLPTLEDIRKLFNVDQSGQAPSTDEDVELEDADEEDGDTNLGGEKKKKCVTAGRKSTAPEGVTTVKKIAAPEKAGRSQSARGKGAGERKQLKRNPTGAAPKGLEDTDEDKTPTGNTPKNASKEGKTAGEG